jgi:branched-chain amino acid transport system substrate-binding protein
MNQLSRRASALLIATAGLLVGATASAQIRIGVVLSLTGPGAAIGGQGQNSVQLWPSEMAGQKVVVTVVNDATDPSTAAKSASRLINEDKVDVIVGSSLTPTSLAMVPVAGEAKTPMVSMGTASAITEPLDERRRWVFDSAPRRSSPPTWSPTISSGAS